MMYYFSEIKWFFKKVLHRRKLWKRIKKHYDAPWEVSEPLLYFSFEMFSEWYEKGNIDMIYWGEPEERAIHAADVPEEVNDMFDKQWEVRLEIERLYFWWNKLRQKHADKLESLFDNYFKKYHSPMWDNWEKREDGSYTMKEKTQEESKEFKKLFSIENKLIQVDTKNLKSLVSMRDHLII